MVSIPANIKVMKPLLCFALALDAILCIIAFSSPGQGYACGIEGNVLPKETAPSADLQSRVEEGYEHIVIYVKDPETGEIFTTLKPDEYGYFKVRLRPGKYLLVVQADEEGLTVLSDAPRIVDVDNREFSNVTFHVETGPGSRDKSALPVEPDLGL